MRLLLVLFVLCSSLAFAQERHLIAELPADADPARTRCFVSPDGRWAAWQSQHGPLVVGNLSVQGDEVVPAGWADGTPGLFSSDSQAWACAVRRGKKWSLVINGKESPAGDFPPVPTYLAQGHSLALVVAKKRDLWVTVEGRQYPTPDAGGSVDMIRLSADGRVVAYSGSYKGVPYVAFSNSTFRLKPGQKVRDLLLNPTGTLVAWTEVGPAGVTLVQNGRKTGDFQEVQRLSWTPDGQHLLYVGRKPGAPSTAYFPDEELARPGQDVDYPMYDPSGQEFLYSVGGNVLWRKDLSAAQPGPGAIPLAIAPGQKVVWLVSDDHGQKTVQTGSQATPPVDELLSRIHLGAQAGFAVRRGRQIWWESLSL